MHLRDEHGRHRSQPLIGHAEYLVHGAQSERRDHPSMRHERRGPATAQAAVERAWSSVAPDDSGLAKERGLSDFCGRNEHRPSVFWLIPSWRATAERTFSAPVLR